MDRTKAPEWVHAVFYHCKNNYIGDDGVLLTSLTQQGLPLNQMPMIDDFGDLLPFAWHFGERSFIDEQLSHAYQYLERGLFKYEGKIKLFHNHDWLLGLLDIYRQAKTPSVMKLAEEGATRIGESFFCGNFLSDEIPSYSNLYGVLVGASPFNGGYIELWVEMYLHTGSERYLNYAIKLFNGWSQHSVFIKNGVFPRKRSARYDFIDSLSVPFSTLKSRLFKDNTNIIWGFLELYKITSQDQIREAIVQWLNGFEKYFFNYGQVALMLSHKGKLYDISLKAAFSSLDLLCDLANEDIQRRKCIKLGESIAKYWLSLQWETGLFPEIPCKSFDHIDANVDMVVALNKLTALTCEQKYSLAAKKCSEAILKYHYTGLGYCLSVNEQGEVVNGEIRVKYQGLLTKLALLPEDPKEIYSNQDIFDLLRDR